MPGLNKRALSGGRYTPDEDVSSSSVTQHAADVIADSNVSGSSFPGSPSNGQVFYRIDVLEWFMYVTSQSAWFGPERHCEFGKGGTGFNDQYLEYGGDAVSSAARGAYIPYDIAITGLTASWSSAITSGDFRVRRNGSNIMSADWGVSGDTSTTIIRTGTWDTFTASGKLQVYLDTLSGGINHPHALVLWRRRLT